MMADEAPAALIDKPTIGAYGEGEQLTDFLTGGGARLAGEFAGWLCHKSPPSSVLLVDEPYGADTHTPMSAAANNSAPQITVALTQLGPLGARLRGRIDADVNLELVASDIAIDDLDAVLAEYEPRVLIATGTCLHGAREVRRVSDAHPKTAIIVLGARLDRVRCVELLAHGASACLPPDLPAHDMLASIGAVARGSYLAPGVNATAQPWRPGVEELTVREVEVYELLRAGRKDRQIAKTLHISVNTAHTHATNIMRKLGVHSRRELIDPALRPPSVEAPALRLPYVWRPRVADRAWVYPGAWRAWGYRTPGPSRGPIELRRLR